MFKEVLDEEIVKWWFILAAVAAHILIWIKLLLYFIVTYPIKVPKVCLHSSEKE